MTYKRGLITDALLAALDNTGKPVGDAEAPEAGGWQGEEGKSAFQPYTVLTPLPSSRTGGPFTDPQGDTTFVYSLSNFAISREGVEWMADKALEIADGFRGTEITSAPWVYQVQYVWVGTYGQVSRLDAVNPSYYARTDTISVSVTRRTS